LGKTPAVITYDGLDGGVRGAEEIERFVFQPSFDGSDDLRDEADVPVEWFSACVGEEGVADLRYIVALSRNVNVTTFQSSSPFLHNS
jgi:hypothetical protein